MNEKKNSKQLCREALSTHYSDIREAKDRGEPIGYCTAQFVKELFESMDLKVVYPENHSAAIAAKDHAAANEYLEYAENHGYSMDLCSYSRINMGYCLSGKPFGRDLDVPMPDYVIVGSNICNMSVHWYENLAWEFDIPYILIDMPFNNQVPVPEYKQEYMVRQLETAVHQLEEITGRKFDYDKFRETMAIADRNGELYHEAQDLIGHDPSPANGHDLLNYLSLMVTMKGSPKTTEVFELWVQELKDRIANNETTFRGEQKYRILSDGIACWPHLRYCNECMANMGCNFTGSSYTDLFFQTYKDVREMVNCYTSLVCNSGMDMWEGRRDYIIDTYKIDGILSNVTRSCKPMIGKMRECNRRLEKKHGIPSALFDGDQSDPRSFSKAQYETRLQGLVEIMEENKKEGK
ncbi:2-hydroxyacyl-CoA dehydratase subunit D [Eubacterium barkeri]|uniref:Benzoyl-CoA reductase/2-hydroxyglutaryl-CoA dehydratase subunit, BcrC/BadD/HgdB n=1 Tax=Eubacterium barkeri TaxID=1528 RepID=A0A1H3I674_EUBBA|nr:2-hydroxyacyl-CoA dehydratase family protein [Eubacterium barkeri]SDY22699.1 Benzoyl-CoA reductase/2-hydroxyglutaryl-CoA dehydratase subunit, BcrC/BadD/HgdB [Eubacterium barkeri]